MLHRRSNIEFNTAIQHAINGMFIFTILFPVVLQIKALYFDLERRSIESLSAEFGK